jgi:hypothetical protein
MRASYRPVVVPNAGSCWGLKGCMPAQLNEVRGAISGNED